MTEKKNKKRNILQSLTWLGLPVVAIGGWFYPLLGFLLLGCMIGSVGIAFFRGRAWCDWMCPRGSFFDLFFSKVSPRRKIPGFLRTGYFRGFMVGLIFVVLGIQIFLARGDVYAMGLAMVRVLNVTTAAGIILALAVHPRTWCHICPMGTLGNWVSRGRGSLVIGQGCVSCQACSKVCPMQLEPYRYAARGVMGDNDCIRCSTCVERCPKKALSFDCEGDKKIDSSAA